VTVVPLDAAIYNWDWTVRLDYLANRDGEIQVALSTGQGARTPVRRGIGSVYLRLIGGGGADLRVSTTAPPPPAWASASPTALWGWSSRCRGTARSLRSSGRGKLPAPRHRIGGAWAWREPCTSPSRGARSATP
jgi:hypothetical protein